MRKRRPNPTPLTVEQLKQSNPSGNLDHLLFNLANGFVKKQAINAGLGEVEHKHVFDAVEQPIADGVQMVTRKVKELGLSPGLIATGLLVAGGLYEWKKAQDAKIQASLPPLAPEMGPQNIADSNYHPSVSRYRGWQ